VLSGCFYESSVCGRREVVCIPCRLVSFFDLLLGLDTLMLLLVRMRQLLSCMVQIAVSQPDVRNQWMHDRGGGVMGV